MGLGDHAARFGNILGMSAFNRPLVRIWMLNCASNGIPADFQRWTVWRESPKARAAFDSPP